MQFSIDIFKNVDLGTIVTEKLYVREDIRNELLFYKDGQMLLILFVSCSSSINIVRIDILVIFPFLVEVASKYNSLFPEKKNILLRRFLLCDTRYRNKKINADTLCVNCNFVDPTDFHYILFRNLVDVKLCARA